MPDQEFSLNRSAVEALMKTLGIDNYAELGRRAGIERTYLSRIMRGERPAQASQIVAIARALKVPLIAVLGPDDAAAAEAAVLGMVAS